MAMVLFAIIGAHLNVGVAYWICYGIFCAIQVARAIYKAVND